MKGSPVRVRASALSLCWDAARRNLAGWYGPVLEVGQGRGRMQVWVRVNVAVVAAATLVLLAAAPALGAGIGLRVLSNRADLVSGDDALVEVTAPAGTNAGDLTLDVDGRDVTPAFSSQEG